MGSPCDSHLIIPKHLCIKVVCASLTLPKGKAQSSQTQGRNPRENLSKAILPKLNTPQSDVINKTENTIFSF